MQIEPLAVHVHVVRVLELRAGRGDKRAQLAHQRRARQLVLGDQFDVVVGRRLQHAQRRVEPAGDLLHGAALHHRRGALERARNQRRLVGALVALANLVVQHVVAHAIRLDLEQAVEHQHAARRAQLLAVVGRRHSATVVDKRPRVRPRERLQHVAEHGARAVGGGARLLSVLWLELAATVQIDARRLVGTRDALDAHHQHQITHAVARQLVGDAKERRARARLGVHATALALLELLQNLVAVQIDVPGLAQLLARAHIVQRHGEKERLADVDVQLQVEHRDAQLRAGARRLGQRRRRACVQHFGTVRALIEIQNAASVQLQVADEARVLRVAKLAVGLLGQRRRHLTLCGAAGVVHRRAQQLLLIALVGSDRRRWRLLGELLARLVVHGDKIAHTRRQRHFDVRLGVGRQRRHRGARAVALTQRARHGDDAHVVGRVQQQLGRKLVVAHLLAAHTALKVHRRVKVVHCQVTRRRRIGARRRILAALVAGASRRGRGEARHLGRRFLLGRRYRLAARRRRRGGRGGRRRVMMVMVRRLGPDRRPLDRAGVQWRQWRRSGIATNRAGSRIASFEFGGRGRLGDSGVRVVGGRLFLLLGRLGRWRGRLGNIFIVTTTTIGHLWLLSTILLLLL